MTPSLLAIRVTDMATYERVYKLEDGRQISVQLVDEGLIVDLIDDGEVVLSYYRFIDELVPMFTEGA